MCSVVFFFFYMFFFQAEDGIRDLVRSRGLGDVYKRQIWSHLMIQKWFGISAFVFVVVSFVAGFKILFKVELLPMIKTLKYSFFAFFFVAASLGYMLSSNGKLLFLAGALGFQMNLWMQSLLSLIHISEPTRPY